MDCLKHCTCCNGSGCVGVKDIVLLKCMNVGFMELRRDWSHACRQYTSSYSSGKLSNPHYSGLVIFPQYSIHHAPSKHIPPTVFMCASLPVHMLTTPCASGTCWIKLCGPWGECGRSVGGVFRGFGGRQRNK